MSERPTHRLRLKLPNGAEMEAEGNPEFLTEAREHFLTHLETAPGQPEDRAGASEPGQPHISWPAITEMHSGRLQLRAKLPVGRTQKDACLVLLAAAQRLLSQSKPTATQLAKWLRGSGYPILRMDRALQDAVSQGDILSSGSRRSRRYELTSSGRLKALLLAEQLTRLVSNA